MTNYVNYPSHRFTKGSCIICFPAGYSWCYLNSKQKEYLVSSGYLDRAERVDVKTYSGKTVSFSVDQFKEWVHNGSPESIASATNHPEKICPVCGKSMVLRVAQKGPNAGKQFWGCSGYPDCKHTESV